MAGAQVRMFMFNRSIFIKIPPKNKQPGAGTDGENTCTSINNYSYNRKHMLADVTHRFRMSPSATPSTEWSVVV